MHLLITLVMCPKYFGSDRLVFSGDGIKSKIAPVPDGIVPSLSNVSSFLIRHVKMMMMMTQSNLLIYSLEFPLSIHVLRLIFSQIIFLK
jgi:hypothetical protein